MEQVTEPTSQFPSVFEQSCFTLTGALAGASTFPIEYGWRSLFTKDKPSVSSIIRSPAVYRGAVRFSVFDHAKTRLNHAPVPYYAVAGLAGAAGGFSEVLVQSLLQRSRPTVSGLGSQSTRLFLCFGTYTCLSTTYSDTAVPKPFWRCWLMGAAAGAVGSSVVGVLEGARGRFLLTTVIPKGAITIGTVIAVQVTSCAALLDSIRHS